MLRCAASSKHLLVSVYAVLAVSCAGARRSARAAEPPQIATFVQPNLEPVPTRSLPTAERLQLLHKAVVGPGDPHDVILELARLRDASSVPFLIEALAKFGAVPREGPYTGIDTRFHCLDALQVITNQEVGRNADDWRDRYVANKTKTKEQWIVEGFAQHQFPVANIEDDSFVIALIRASDPKYRPAYVRTNALQMLATVPGDRVVRLARPLAASADAADRRATVAALEGISDVGRFGSLQRPSVPSYVRLAATACVWSCGSSSRLVSW
jgi:hypothetical protein